jgi:zinc-binding in reverse transcriptase
MVLLVKPTNAAQRRLCIRDLIHPQSDEWNTGNLVSIFGFHIALYLAVTFPNPPRRMLVPDSLVFTVALHGNYTVQMGYHMLRGRATVRTGTTARNTYWKLLRRHRDVIPRIQLFLWRIAHNAVPVGACWAQRLRLPIPPYAVCGLDSDTVMHVIFTCQFARAVWLVSPLSLQSHALFVDFF